MPPATSRKKRSTKVKLICPNEDLAKAHAKVLNAGGFATDFSSLRGTSGLITHIRAIAPDVIVIDLDRLPSHGKEAGADLRNSKSTRHIPIVFAGGQPEKVGAIRSLLPDATYTEWKRIIPALRGLKAPKNPVTAIPHMLRWSTTPLWKKLGIAAGMRVPLMTDRPTLEEILVDLPEDVSFSSRITAENTLALYLVTSVRELAAAFDHAAAHLPPKASLWILHPKSTKNKSTTELYGFNQDDVRTVGLARGLVDYKVCSVNEELSALKFAWRKKS